MKETLLLATGQKQIDEIVSTFEEFTIVGSIDKKNKLMENIQKHKPTTVLVGEGLSGTEILPTMLMSLKQSYPAIRFVYLAGFIENRATAKMDGLSMLVHAGIYDIFHKEKLTKTGLYHLLTTPQALSDVQHLYDRLNKKMSKSTGEIEVVDEEVKDTNSSFDNVFTFSSIKPGTGKSFISVNVAMAIAAFGKTKDGKKPRVALIEADLQNLSVGTLLQIEDDKYNLASALEKISTIVGNHGETIGTLSEIEDVNQFVKRCLISYSEHKNLQAIVGSQLKFEDVENFSYHHYIYLIKMVSELYDIVIIDTNSDLMHVTTYPLLSIAERCFYILNMDYNNIRNNIRYQSTLNEINILDKVEYILNEDITKEDYYTSSLNPETLDFSHEQLKEHGFNPIACIPTLPRTVFLNRLYQGRPVILDTTDYTEVARQELYKIAKSIMRLDVKEEKKEEEKFIGILRILKRNRN